MTDSSHHRAAPESRSTPAAGPIAGETLQAPTPAHDHDAQAHGRGARVLVIDDEPELQRAIHTRLAGEHFLVEEALTGADGLDLVTRWHPDVVILDLTLPDIDGIEVCRRIRTWS